MIVEQDAPAVEVLRRTEQGFVREVFAGLEATVPLSELEIELPLAELFEGVEFPSAAG